MEKSTRVKTISSGRYLDYRSQHNQLRCLSIEQALEYEDKVEPSVRYSHRKPTAGAKQREWAQSRGMGRDTGMSED